MPLLSSDSSESDIIARVEAAGNKITKNYSSTLPQSGLPQSGGGGVYYGQMKGDKRHGYGTMTVADVKYVGEWKNGCFNGYGTMTQPDGTIFHSGEWVNNSPKK